MSANRFTTVLVLGLSLSLFLTEFASAQRRGGRGFFGAARIQLASLKEVQSELKLTDEQKKAAEDISQQLNDDRRELFQGGGGSDFNAMREKMQKLNDDADAKLTKKLDDGQRQRLMEIYVQVNGTSALADKEVAKALEISDEQQKALTSAQDENRQAGFRAFQDFREMSDEERREAFAKLREEGDQRMLAPLNDAQREQFGKLKGEEIEIDMSQLFRRRGGRQGAAGGGERRRPARPE